MHDIVRQLDEKRAAVGMKPIAEAKPDELFSGLSRAFS